MDTSLDFRLAAAGLSLSHQRQQALPAPLRELHQVILQEFTTRGRAPARTELAPIAARLDLAVDAALADLAASDLVIPGDDGEIHVAYPFSTTPTGHQVELTGGPTVFAMCAIDALGIPAMTGRDATITATDPANSIPLHIDTHAGQPHARPADTVVSLATTGQGGPNARTCCPLINFHVSDQAARAYQDQAGLPGTVLTLLEATEAATHLFGPLLHPDP